MVDELPALPNNFTDLFVDVGCEIHKTVSVSIVLYTDGLLL